MLEMSGKMSQQQPSYTNLKDCSFLHSSLQLNSCCDSSMLRVVEQIMLKLRDFVNRLLHVSEKRIHLALDTGKTWMQGMKIIQ